MINTVVADENCLIIGAKIIELRRAMKQEAERHFNAGNSDNSESGINQEFPLKVSAMESALSSLDDVESYFGEYL